MLVTMDEPASPLGDDSQGEACPTVYGLEEEQDRANIPKTSTLPHDSTSRVTSIAANEGSVDKSIKRGSNDTEELVNVLTSLDAASILSSGVQVVPPAAEVATVSVPTVSGVVPTASLIFTTASVVTPYIRRKGKDKMVESETPKKKKIQEQMDVQMAREIEEQLAREDQRMIAKYLQEYEQFAANLDIEERIELINDLVKYQDNYAKVLKYQSQQRKPLSKKQQREFYMSVLRSHIGWKTKHFKGMSLEEIREKFIPVWKQIKDFVPMGSKEEEERFKRKGLRLEQDSANKVKTSEEVSKEDLKIMMQLVPVKEVYVEALQVKHTIIDWEIHTEGQRTYWKIIRSIRLQAVQDKEMIEGILSRISFDSGNLIADGALSLGEDCWE
uniref:Uncharacterized protein n=1 Tax=Tanacetum cinerariifolium TaxID=118510 RepID=A0A699K2P0_TANCI|nr:hypothetical protein [Tanacetum cinerariifolium]